MYKQYIVPVNNGDLLARRCLKTLRASVWGRVFLDETGKMKKNKCMLINVAGLSASEKTDFKNPGGGHYLTFGTRMLMCLFRVCNLGGGAAKLFGV